MPDDPRNYAFWLLAEAEGWPHADVPHPGGRPDVREACPRCNAVEHAVEVWKEAAEGRVIPEQRHDWSPRP